MQIHASLGDLVITGSQAIKHHRAIGIRSLRGRLVVVAANKVHFTRGP